MYERQTKHGKLFNTGLGWVVVGNGEPFTVLKSEVNRLNLVPKTHHGSLVKYKSTELRKQYGTIADEVVNGSLELVNESEYS